MRDTESVVQGKGFSVCCCERFVKGEECLVCGVVLSWSFSVCCESCVKGKKCLVWSVVSVVRV